MSQQQQVPTPGDLHRVFLTLTVSMFIGGVLMTILILSIVLGSPFINMLFQFFGA